MVSKRVSIWEWGKLRREEEWGVAGWKKGIEKEAKTQDESYATEIEVEDVGVGWRL